VRHWAAAATEPAEGDGNHDSISRLCLDLLDDMGMAPGCKEHTIELRLNSSSVIGTGFCDSGRAVVKICRRTVGFILQWAIFKPFTGCIDTVASRAFRTGACLFDILIDNRCLHRVVMKGFNTNA
jgi:hypothetical protein